MSDVLEHSALERWQANPISFIEEILRNPKDGKPFKLFPEQKLFFEHCWNTGPDGHLLYPDQCIGWIKKTGKTATSAMHGLVTTLVYGERNAEAYCISNDFEQAQGRVFTAMRQICEASPLLKRECDITQSRLSFPQTGAFVQALGGDANSAAGAQTCWASADELHGFVSERSRRLYEELIPVPTQRISCRLVTTHAGYSGESMLLEELYNKGMALPEIAPGLRAGGHMLFTWSHVPLASWQTVEWLEQMRAITRPIQYLRQFENRFVSSENSFIPLAAWDRCVRPDLAHVRADLFCEAFVGIDASVKHDAAAIVVVTFDRSTQMVRLLTHKVFQPSPEEPLDFELTIEAFLIDLARRFQLRLVRYDPYQMVSTAQRLAKAGIPMEEFPQSSPNLTAASQNLYDLIMSQALAVYPDAEMRLAVSRAVAIETPRGWRIAKTSQAHKIDSIIALGMACHAACAAQAEPWFDRSWAFVDGTPIGGTETVEARKAKAKQEADDFYAARLHAYLAQHGAFGFGPPWGQR
jgi:phage terminase large subunit-like protein